jgi:hypothetical protein
MHIGESQIRFGMVSSRIFIGEKRYGTSLLYKPVERGFTTPLTCFSKRREIGDRDGGQQ